MPELDLTHVVRDPRFSCLVTVTRRQLLVGDDGRGTIAETTYPNTVCVITTGGDNRLVRDADQQNMPKTITVHSEFRLRGPALDSDDNSWQPDAVTWLGNNYIVTEVVDYSQWGAGFIAAQCQSIQAIDQPAP